MKRINYQDLRRDFMKRSLNVVDDYEAKSAILEDFNDELIKVIDVKEDELKVLRKRNVEHLLEEDIKKLAIRNIARHGMKYIMTSVVVVCLMAYFKVEGFSTIVALCTSIIGLVSGILMTAMEAKDYKTHEVEEEEIDAKL